MQGSWTASVLPNTRPEKACWLAGPCCSTQSVVGDGCETVEKKCWSQDVARWNDEKKGEEGGVASQSRMVLPCVVSNLFASLGSH